MNALTPATWPSEPDLPTRRWALQLLAGLTNEIHALGCGHHLLSRLLQHPDPLPPDTLPDGLHAIDQTIVTWTNSPALLNLARPHRPDVHRLLRDAFARRTDHLDQLRRLHPPVHLRLGWPPNIDDPNLRGMLGNLLADIDHTGQMLAHADRLLTRELATGEQPTTPPDTPS